MKQFPNIVAAVIAIGTGAFVLSLSVPQTVAAFTLLSVAHIQDKVVRRQEVLMDDLLRLQEAQQAAIVWVPSGKQIHNRSLTEITLAAAASKQSAVKKKWLDQAEASVQEGLLRAPANPNGWTWLAYLHLKNGGRKASAHKALIMSILTGPHEKHLATGRIRYAISLWDRLSPETRNYVKEQIVWADNHGRRNALLKIARRSLRAKRIIFWAFTNEPRRLRGFKKGLAG